MTPNTGAGGNQTPPNDASRHAFEREKSTPPEEMPVKQHNPDNRGLNPGQKGPSQPSTPSDSDNGVTP